MYPTHKAQLPPSELGEDRCFAIKYFGHGDILAATWRGSIDLTPSHADGISTRFGFTHGSDVMILASLAGYLKRLGRADAQVREVMHQAGAEVLGDDSAMRQYHQNLGQGIIRMVANGQPLTRFDVPEHELACLALPVPSSPGVLEESGGTGIYTRVSDAVGTTLVFAEHVPVRAADGRRSTAINETADFCEQDVPVMAQLVCAMALGEYRRDIQSFLMNMYQPDAD